VKEAVEKFLRGALETVCGFSKSFFAARAVRQMPSLDLARAHGSWSRPTV